MENAHGDHNSNTGYIVGATADEITTLVLGEYIHWHIDDGTEKVLADIGFDYAALNEDKNS